uniref:Retrovirus-related Pol polyprotein from transposon TNT 1-94 n=1 Tax=Cajanus cajan TaxID=3821 RepID=A0A151QP26_CAJCA|nr:Retrovirus-related Pol polyprotein from transposon TNT 1-94 [Cajanus cajan]
MFMRMTVSTLPKTESAKEFMGFTGERSQTANKSLVGILMSTLTTIKFDGSRTMHEHVIEMTNIVAGLKSLGMAVNENFLVQFILNSLPTEYGPFQMSYNTMKDKWNVHELHRHFQKDCPKHKAWFKKKVPHNTWWIDFGCTTHVSNTMQGFTTIQTISPNEKFIFMGNRVKVLVEAIGTYRLILKTRHHLDLLETLYVPYLNSSLSRNLVSLSKLDAIGYSFTFGNGCFSLFKHNHLIGTGILCDGLYKLNLDGLYDETLLTLHHNIGTKRSLVNERSSFLWHRHLGHISRERMKRLIKNKILPNLDFTDLNICVDCIKGKQTKHTKKGATRSTLLLEIVHTDICGPFDVNSFRKEKYFITLIDDYSRYGYVYLLHEKSQAVNALKIYLNEVERQLDKKLKSWKSAKQTVVVSSTMEAEFVACFEATIQDNWLRNFISGLGIVDSIAKPLKMYCDNSAAVFFSKNDKYSKGAKHMELKYFVVKKEVQKQRVSIEHISINLMIDPLTKGLLPKTFIKHVKNMGIIVTNDC